MNVIDGSNVLKVYFSIPESKYPKVTKRRRERLYKIAKSMFIAKNWVWTTHIEVECDCAMFAMSYMRYDKCKSDNKKFKDEGKERIFVMD